MAVSKIMVQTKGIHQQTWDFNLVFTKYGKEDGIYPQKKEIAKHKTKIKRSIATTCKNTNKGFAFSTY
jgi:hypothetical protein